LKATARAVVRRCLADSGSKRVTMVVNDDRQVVADPDGAVRPIWGKIATA
jgi:hypothetical protein